MQRAPPGRRDRRPDHARHGRRRVHSSRNGGSSGSDGDRQHRRRSRASGSSPRSTPARSTSCRSRRRSPPTRCSRWPTSWWRRSRPRAAPRSRGCAGGRPSGSKPRRRSPRRGAATVDIVLVIGISTGGPQALKAFIPRLPADFPVPWRWCCTCRSATPSSTRGAWMRSRRSTVPKAKQGEQLRPGCVLVAPAGRHLRW